MDSFNSSSASWRISVLMGQIAGRDRRTPRQSSSLVQYLLSRTSSAGRFPPPKRLRPPGRSPDRPRKDPGERAPVPGVEPEAGPGLPLRCLKALSCEQHYGVRSGLSSPRLARAIRTTSHFCFLFSAFCFGQATSAKNRSVRRKYRPPITNATVAVIVPIPIRSQGIGPVFKREARKPSMTPAMG